jgi:late competence protein required for DNA uptake (superfamily II DNA/RNA helicase)
VEAKKVIVEYTKEEETSIVAVEKIKGKYVCHRCSNQKQSRFYQDERGIYCEECLMFGKSSTYTLIQRQYQSLDEKLPYSLNKIIYLSELQQIASKKCLSAYEKKRDILIFAVCIVNNEN